MQEEAFARRARTGPGCRTSRRGTAPRSARGDWRSPSASAGCRSHSSAASPGAGLPAFRVAQLRLDAARAACRCACRSRSPAASPGRRRRSRTCRKGKGSRRRLRRAIARCSGAGTRSPAATKRRTPRNGARRSRAEREQLTVERRHAEERVRPVARDLRQHRLDIRPVRVPGSRWRRWPADRAGRARARRRRKAWRWRSCARRRRARPPRAAPARPATGCGAGE